MRLYGDFHIHTALSPCGDENMTPNNIVNMAKLKGLDVIAITDHNSCENVESCMETGKEIGLLVIPGMELQTREEIHVVCLFGDIKKAHKFQEIVFKHLPNIKNRSDIFGEQLILDTEDNIIGHNDRMLLSSVDLSFDEAFELVKSLGGYFIPAHIDRDSYSIFVNLGFIPDYLDIKTLEYYSREAMEKLISRGKLSSKYKFIKSSDAHYLEQICEQNEGTVFQIDKEIVTIEDVLNLF